MKTSRHITSSLKLALALGTLWTGAARAELALPMEGYEAASPINRLDSRVLVGAAPQALPGGDFAINPTTTLYVAPHKASVDDASLQTYPTANCGVVSNELASEKTVSDLVRWNIDQIKEQKPYIASLNSEIATAGRACLDAIKAHDADRDAKCEYKKELNSQIRELGEAITPWEKTISDLSDGSQKRLEQLGKEPGGYAVANVLLDSTSELNALRNANPGYSITTVPTQSVVFSFVPGKEDIDASLPKRTTLGFALASQDIHASAAGGSGQAVTQVMSGRSVALGITLSRLGACMSDLRRNGTFFYNFPTYTYLKGSVSYNRWATYQRIQKSSSKGGFFTTKTTRELSEEMKNGEDFKFATEGNESIDAETMKERMRGQMLSNLLSMWAEVHTMGEGQSTLSMPDARANGADATGDAALKCPHVYCQVAGYALKSLSAIFGRAISDDSAKQEWNTTITENWGYTTRHTDSDSASAIVRWTN